MSTKLISLNDFKIINSIGSNSLNEIAKINQNSSNLNFVAKIIFRPLSEDIKSENSQFQQEINIVSKINHPSLVKMAYFSPVNFHNEAKPVLINEYIKNGSVSDIKELKNSQFWTDTIKLINLYGISSIMSKLHSHKITYRNFKLSNILLDEFLFPKIDFFGFSRFTNSNDTKIPRYIAPETWEKSEYSQASDIYAFGILMYEIMTNEEPFKECKFYEIPAKVTAGIRPNFNVTIPDQYKKLIEKCWAQNPADRPTFDQIVESLSNDSRFITDKIDEDYYLNYIDYINDYIEKIGSFKDSASIEKYLKRKTKCFKQIEIQKENPIENNTNQSEIAKNNTQSSSQNTFVLDDETIDQYNLAINLSQGNGMPVDKKEAARMFKIVADKGYPPAMNNYGNIKLNGIGVPEDKKEAVKYFKKAADLGHKISMFNYAICAQNGDGMPKDLKEAAKIYKSLSDEGDEDAMDSYANILALEESGIYDPELAVKYYKMAIDKGHLGAMNNYALMLFNGSGIKENVNESIKLLKTAADKGFKQAIFNLSKAISMAKQDVLNKTEVLNYHKKAADLDYLFSMKLYASMLEKGDGTPVNIQEALRYYKMAADKGDEESKQKYEALMKDKTNTNDNAKGSNDVESIYDRGFKIFREGIYKDAAPLLKEAADKGHTAAMYLYAAMLLSGIDVDVEVKKNSIYIEMAYEKDHDTSSYVFLLCSRDDGIPGNKKEGAKYLKMAADKGDKDAQYYYSYVLKNGDGVPQNHNESIKYLKLAVENEQMNACIRYISMLISGEGVPVNIDEAAKIAKKIADKYDDINMLKIYKSILLSRDDLEGAFKYVKKGAMLGNPDFMNEYGVMLKEGTGTQQNTEEGIKYIKMAADKGCVSAMKNYGFSVFNPEDPDPEKIKIAFKYFDQAALFGQDLESIQLCAMFLSGLCGHKIDLKESASYFKKGADMEDELCMHNYGKLCLEGKGVPVNKQEAAKYIKKAADKGFVESMKLYSLMLAEGDGVPVNKAESEKYAKMAKESS